MTPSPPVKIEKLNKLENQKALQSVVAAAGEIVSLSVCVVTGLKPPSSVVFLNFLNLFNFSNLLVFLDIPVFPIFHHHTPDPANKSRRNEDDHA